MKWFRDLNVFNTGVISCCHSVFQQMEFPVENGAASPPHIILVQWLVIIQMQFVLAVDSINILFEQTAQNINCKFHFNSGGAFLNESPECKIIRPNTYHVCLILSFASPVWLAVLCIFLCHICLTCFCLIFHLRNKKA